MTLDRNAFYVQKGKTSIIINREVSRVEEILKIDPSLNLEEMFEEGSLFVGKVNREKEELVLKLAFYGLEEFHIRRMNQLQKERKTLEQLEGIEEVPKIIKFYDCEGYAAILKTFLPGEHPIIKKDYPIGLNNTQKANLLELISKIHDRGIANLELDQYNNRRSVNILTKGDKVYLFDFGFACSTDECTIDEFEDYKRKDLIHVTS